MDALERFRIALELADLAEQMMRQKLRRQNPGADEAQIERMLDDWLARRPGAEFGDAEGIPVTLPRAST